MDDEQGLENCATGLRRLLPLAEKLGLKLVMELLNSKIDHPGYMCDHSAWGIELCERLGSEHFSLLYDIYHMQVMEGDVIHTIPGTSTNTSPTTTPPASPDATKSTTARN